MAKVKEVRLCKACQTELLVSNQPVCHMCGFRMLASITEANQYASPDYLYYQKVDFTAIAVKGIPEKDVERRYKASEDLNAELVVWLRSCPEEDKLAALHDAHMHLKYAVVSPMKVDTLRNIVTMGKHVGALATNIENYLKTQGATNATSSATGAEPDDDLQSP